MTISPVPQQEPSRSVIQTKSSQTSQHHRISVNFLPTQSTIQTTSRTFYPTSRTSSKPQKTSSQRIIQQHIHVPPLPAIPNLKPRQVTINLSPPDIQKIVQNPPPLLPSQSRVIVTAKASVSDESGRPLNTSQLITLPLPTIPSSYDDYKEGDESFDPFYRDVPKIRSNQRIVVSSRSSRSPNRRIIFHRHKRETPKNTNVQKVDRDKANDTEVSSIVRNLRKLKNIFFATDFDDSDEPNYFNSEEMPSNFGSGLRNDNIDYLDDNVKLAMSNPKNSAGKQFTESGKESWNEEKDKMPSRIIEPTRRNAYDISNEKEKTILETTSVSHHKNSEIEYYDKEIANDHSRDTKSSRIVGIPDAEPKTPEIEYYDNEEISKGNQENVNTTGVENEEPEVEEYVYDPDELFVEEYYTTTKTPIIEKTTKIPDYKIESTTKTTMPKITTPKITKVETTTFQKLDNKQKDSLIIENYPKETDLKSVLKDKNKIETAPIKTKSEISEVDKVNNNNTISKKESEELLLTKSSSNRKKSKSSESAEYSEEQLAKQYSEEEEELLPNKSRRKNLVKSKYIPDSDYLGDEEYEDYEEERRLERRKNSKRRKPTQSRSRLDYETDPPRSRGSSRRTSSWQKERGRSDLRDRGRDSRRRKKPILVESEESEYDYYSEELRSSDEDWYDEEIPLERERNQRNKGRGNKGIRYEDPPRSGRRRVQGRKFRDEDLDYDSREASTLSSREDDWSADYPTSKELPDDSQTEIIDYTEDSRNYDDVTGSAEDVTTETSLEDETFPTEEAFTGDGITAKGVTPSIKDILFSSSFPFVKDELPVTDIPFKDLTTIENVTPTKSVTSKNVTTTKTVTPTKNVSPTKSVTPSRNVAPAKSVTPKDETDVTPIKDVTDVAPIEDVIEEEISSVTEKEFLESDPGVLKYTDELSEEERMDATTEMNNESPMKDQKQSPVKDMKDYIDDNYEPSNYKGRKNKNESRNSTRVQTQNNFNSRAETKAKKGGEQTDEEHLERRLNEMKPIRNKHDHELGENGRAEEAERTEESTKERKEENTKERKENTKERKESTKERKESAKERTEENTKEITKETDLEKPDLEKNPENTDLENTNPKKTEEVERSTAATTQRSSRRGTRPTKATGRTTPPKLFKPLTGKRNYLYIPPSTTPVPVVIKRRISLVHPRPAKPPKSYNELAPKPVIRKKLLEARKTIIETILTTTSEYEEEFLQMTPEPLATSEASISQKETEDNLKSAPATSPKEIEEVPSPNFESDLENKIKKQVDEKTKDLNDEKPKEEKETEKNEPKEENYEKISSSTENYPYLLSRLSTPLAKSEEITKNPIGEMEDSTLGTTAVPKLSSTKSTPTSKLTPGMKSTPTSKSFSKSDNFEPKSESTKPEITLVRTPTIQKASKRTTKKDPTSLGGSYQGFNCLGKEMYRFYGDKRDCRLFHYCSPGFTSTQVLDFKFVCEQGTHFDESTQSCRHNYKNSECTVRIFW